MEERLRPRFMIVEDMPIQTRTPRVGCPCRSGSTIKWLGEAWTIADLRATIKTLPPNSYNPACAYIVLPIDGSLVKSQDGQVNLDEDALLANIKGVLSVVRQDAKE